MNLHMEETFPATRLYHVPGIQGAGYTYIFIYLYMLKLDHMHPGLQVSQRQKINKWEAALSLEDKSGLGCTQRLITLAFKYIWLKAGSVSELWHLVSMQACETEVSPNQLGTSCLEAA